MCEVLMLIICLALAFDFINGFHDTANAVATSLATGALTTRSAILLATTMNFLGALTFTEVALTIAESIVDTAVLFNNPKTILAALLAAIVWNLFTWFGGLPSSSSHALVGALTGATLAAAGLMGVNLAGLANIFQALVLSPLLAVTAGFTVMSIVFSLTRGRASSRLNRHFRHWQRLTAALQAFSHGTNDAQKTMGVITLALILTGYQQSFVVPLWVKILSALALALGTSCGGWRIIRTVGRGITHLDPPAGFAADMGSALVIFTATLLGLPVSTTHVISSSITGVGLTRGAKAVSWSTVARILLAWVFTLPATTVLGALFYIPWSLP
ncbi:inorganic phosphate transporter [Desulfofundulus thermosubterraneus]|uniref:Inorganic phosphate transporter, PiT family n=1 Tax=Desulfofundulus thermosubterraneus DSM 16057 TaxID=1121432 RepID=A0A1M6IHS3_9FIRM|nr:inorganic phosphate transporter [Desulfofundulus thermosubterraneus]SHJ33978.1 inorganic phosphate transporter, PiT family [Desulfofundulus thermosubterraneus DSM 16057]